MLQGSATSTVASVNLCFVWVIEVYRVLIKWGDAISQLILFKSMCWGSSALMGTDSPIPVPAPLADLRDLDQ